VQNSFLSLFPSFLSFLSFFSIHYNINTNMNTHILFFFLRLCPLLLFVPSTLIAQMVIGVWFFLLFFFFLKFINCSLLFCALYANRPNGDWRMAFFSTYYFPFLFFLRSRLIAHMAIGLVSFFFNLCGPSGNHPNGDCWRALFFSSFY
jgi:hypothetical protein